MKVILLTPLAGINGAFTVGDPYDCSKDEAKRLIERGYAEPVKKTRSKKTAKK